MKNDAVKVMIAAAIFTLPVFGGTLMAREHHRKNTAAEIIDAVARLLNPRPVVVAPAPPPPPRPVVVVPAHHPAPRHHAPAPRPAPRKGGHRR